MKISLLPFFLVGIKFAVSSSDFLLDGIIFGTRKIADNVIEVPLVDSSMHSVGGLLGGVNDPDTNRNVTELIASKGYPVDNHYVRTSDGYILCMQRIPHGRNEKAKSQKSKEVVLLFHGLMAASDSFVLNFPGQSLGFVLADAGYDVWMGNFRGNRYSNRHVKYTTDDQEFWDYTFDHLGEVDSPAMINYVLKATKRKDLFLIGESLGTTAAFAALAASPRLNKKIKLYIAISPVSYAGNLVSTARYLCMGLNYFDKIRGPTALKEVSKLDDAVLMLLCGTSLRDLTCKSIFTYFGTNPTYANETRFGVYTAHFPSVSSTRLMAHYGQLAQSGSFCKFDYGIIENWSRYGQITPPSYNLKAVTCPVMLIWSEDDNYSHPTDLDKCRNELPNLYDDYCIPVDKFTHLDFAIALNLDELLFPKIIKAMKKIALERRRGG